MKDLKQDLRFVVDSSSSTEPAVKPVESSTCEEVPLKAGVLIAGRYEVKELIGEGAWSHVYKAECNVLRRYVVLKVLKEHLLSDPKKLSRFRQEADVISQLNHPHIATVYDYGLINEKQPFIVMEYLSGKTLAQIVKAEGKLSTERAISYLIQALNGLNAAHKVGIIHRDIKPGNIFVSETPDGSEIIKLLDFGLSTYLPESQHAHITTTHETIGTVTYMSPEQCQGHKLDVRSDLYSLGCVAFEILTGKYPFSGSGTYEIMEAHIRRKPVGVSLDNPILSRILRKALTKQLERRYQSASEMRDALILASAYSEVQPEQKNAKLVLIMRAVTRAAVPALACLALWVYHNVPLPSFSPSVVQKVAKAPISQPNDDIKVKTKDGYDEINRSFDAKTNSRLEHIVHYKNGRGACGFTDKHYKNNVLTHSDGAEWDQFGTDNKYIKQSFGPDGSLAQETISAYPDALHIVVQEKFYHQSGNLACLKETLAERDNVNDFLKFTDTRWNDKGQCTSQEVTDQKNGGKYSSYKYLHDKVVLY